MTTTHTYDIETAANTGTLQTIIAEVTGTVPSISQSGRLGSESLVHATTEQARQIRTRLARHGRTWTTRVEGR